RLFGQWQLTEHSGEALALGEGVHRGSRIAVRRFAPAAAVGVAVLIERDVVSEVPVRDVGFAGVDSLLLTRGVQPYCRFTVGADVDRAGHRVLRHFPAAGGPR